MVKKALIFSVLICLCPVVMFAQQGKDKRERTRRQSLRQMDRDGDRKISRGEAEKAKEERPTLYENFGMIDTDADSLLDRKELRIFLENRRAAARAARDSVDVE